MCRLRINLNSKEAKQVRSYGIPVPESNTLELTPLGIRNLMPIFREVEDDAAFQATTNWGRHEIIVNKFIQVHNDHVTIYPSVSHH